MIISHNVEIPEWLSLSVIGVSLSAGIVASLLIPDTNPQLPEED
jgi:tellurite resistance protein TerC